MSFLGPNFPRMRRLVILLMSNGCYLAVILIFFWWLLGGYCSLPSGYWWLLPVTARYWSFPLLVWTLPGLKKLNDLAIIKMIYKICSMLYSVSKNVTGNQLTIILLLWGISVVPMVSSWSKISQCLSPLNSVNYTENRPNQMLHL